MAETLEQRITRFHALAVNLLPRGFAWARDAGTGLSNNLLALITEFARVEEAADTYRTEMDPSQTTALLTEWEGVLGLPDDCGTPTTTAGRRAAIFARLTGGGTNTEGALAAAVASFDASTELAAVHHPTQFEVGTDSGGAGMPVGSDEWANVVTLEITTGNPSLDEAGLECVLNGIRRAHGVYHFEYYDNSATFRGTTDDFVVVGPSVTAWTNIGEVLPLPAGMTGTATATDVSGETWAEFAGVALQSTDDWSDYVGAETKCIIAVLNVDSMVSPSEIVVGASGVQWILGLVDSSGPNIAAYNDDGGSPDTTPLIPIAFGTTYVVEMLHEDGVLTCRVYDSVNGWRSESVASPATTATAGDLVAGGFHGLLAYVATYGARDRLPSQAHRDAITAALIDAYA